jgi:putative oxidoreductase
MNEGILLLRVAVGLLIAAHGAQKLFGAFSGPGIEGTAGYLGSLGYPRSRELAWLAGAVEFGGGLLLVLGCLVPFAAAAIVGQLLNAMWSAHHHVLWNHADPPGIEFPLTLSVIALALAWTGGGRFSIDHALGLPLYGWGWFLAALVVGVVAGMVALAMRRPPTSAQVEQTAPIEPNRAA